MVCIGLILALPAALAADGTSRQALTTSLLRVCADPSNLPYSSKDLTGFENRIIALIGEELGLEVRYTWFPQTTGFVRNTLRLRQCDLISGITTTSEKVQNTNFYYQSVYTLLYRKDSGLSAKKLADTDLEGKRIGVVAGTPPANILAQLGMLANVAPYHLLADTRRVQPARQAVLDVDAGKIDAAVIWGPLAAYHSRDAENEMVLVPLVNDDSGVRLNFTVSMAVRYNETDWKHRINDVLENLEPQIQAILEEYGVPLLDERGNLQVH